MPESILIDTNVVLDMAMRGRPGHVAALQLLDDIEMGHTSAMLCATSLKDIYYMLTKYMGKSDARAYVQALLSVFQISAVDKAVCLQAISSDEPDFEDGLVRACAEKAKATYIVSRDEGAFLKSSIKRLDAAGYVAKASHWEDAGI